MNSANKSLGKTNINSFWDSEQEGTKRSNNKKNIWKDLTRERKENVHDSWSTNVQYSLRAFHWKALYGVATKQWRGKIRDGNHLKITTLKSLAPEVLRALSTV